MSDHEDDANPKVVKPLRIETPQVAVPEKPKETKEDKSTKVKSAKKNTVEESRDASKTTPPVVSPVKDAPPEANPDLDDVNPYDDEEERILQENKHIAEYANTKIEVTLGDPVLRSSGAFSKDYIDYAISGTDKKGKFLANRRYKEFELLRTKLEEMFPLFFIPGLPEKKAVNNTSPEFVKARQRGLEHFIFRLSKLSHMWYSNEMQHFLRAKEQFTPFMTAVKKPTYQAMYERNRELFADCDAEPSQEQLDLALRQFPMVSHSKQFFSSFRDHTKTLMEGAKKERFLRSKMVSFTVRDYTQKLDQPAAVKKVQDKLSGFKNLMGVPPSLPPPVVNNKLRKASKADEKSDITQSNFAEDSKGLESSQLSATQAGKPQPQLVDVELVWSNLYTRLSGIHTDLEVFCLLEGQFNQNKKEIEEMKNKTHQLNQQINKLKSQDVTEVREGLFKFKTKDEKLKSLDREEKELQAEILAAEKNYSLMASGLIKYQLPLLLYSKNTEVKTALKALASQRIEQTNYELELLRELHAHYKLY